MYQIDDATAAATQPADESAGTEGHFTEGGPGGTPAATKVRASWLNMVQNELGAIVDEVGLTHSKSDDGQVLKALKILLSRGDPEHLVGTLSYVSASVVRLAPGIRGLVSVAIDDAVLEISTDLDFDIATDLETGPEAASTWYYAYVSNESGVLTPHISATAPEMSPANKVGYHPTNTDWRFVEAVYNDASSNFLPFDQMPDGSILLQRMMPDAAPFHVDVGTTLSGTNFTAITFGVGALPLSCRYAHLNSRIQADDTYLSYAPAALVGSAIGNGGTRRVAGASSTGSNEVNALQFEIPIDPTARQLGYATQLVDGGNGTVVVIHKLNVIGWRS